MKRKVIFIILTVIFVFVFGGGVALGITMYHEKIAGLGKWEWTNEVDVDEIEPEPLDDQVIVKVVPTTNTVADKTYSVFLELDDVTSGSQTVSWTSAEIASNTKKTLMFSATLTTAAVVEVKVK